MNINKSNRPIIKIELTIVDKIIEAIALLVLTCTIILVAYYYNKLSDIIPTHFNFSGKVDDYGSKTSILTLPILSTLLYIGLSVLNKYPQTFNYLGEITLDNAESQYRFATRFLRVLKLIVMITFLIIIFSIVRSI
jgi:uncharacterized membrane protein